MSTRRHPLFRSTQIGLTPATHRQPNLLWHTMMRVGTAHSLDLDDYCSDEQYLEVHHRPETGTPMKNKEDGERLVALSDDLCELLADWIANKRPDVSDDPDKIISAFLNAVGDHDEEFPADEYQDVTELSENDVYEIEKPEYVRKAEVDEERKETRLQGLRDQLAAAEGDDVEQLHDEIEELESRIEELTEFKSGASFHTRVGGEP